MMRNYSVLVISVVLTACASPVPREWIRLEHAASCCDGFASLHYQSLPVGELLKSELSASSAVFDFPEGKSYFAAYNISGSFTGGTVYVAGYGSGFAKSDASWFYPAVTVLNEEFLPIGYSDDGVPIHSGGYWHGETTIENRMHDVSERAKYVIVHFPARARNGRIGGSLDQANTVEVVSGNAVPGGARNVTIDIPLAPVGRFKIAVLPKGQSSPDDSPRSSFWYHISGLDPK